MLNQLPGFAGKLMEDYFCKLPKIDEGLAVGGALDVIAWAIGGRCRVQPPSVTARWKDSDIPQPLAWNPLVLVGPGGKEVVEATESLLGLVDNKPPPAGPVWPQAAPLPPRERSRLST